MKYRKRLLALVLAVVMMCPLTVFGAEAEDTKEVLRQALARNQQWDDVNGFYDFTFTISGGILETLGAEPMTMRAEMNLKANHLQYPAQLKYMSYMRTTELDGTETVVTTYETDGCRYSDETGTKLRTEAVPGGVESLLPEDMSRSLIMGYLQLGTPYPSDTGVVIPYYMDPEDCDSFMRQFYYMGFSMEEQLEAQGMAVRLTSIHGDYGINDQGQIEKYRMTAELELYTEGLSVPVNGEIRLEIGFADPGQPVEVPLPNPAEYVQNP